MQPWRGRQNGGGVDSLLLIFKSLDGVKEETPGKRKREWELKLVWGYYFRELGMPEGIIQPLFCGGEGGAEIFFGGGYVGGMAARECLIYTQNCRKKSSFFPAGEDLVIWYVS